MLNGKHRSEFYSSRINLRTVFNSSWYHWGSNRRIQTTVCHGLDEDNLLMLMGYLVAYCDQCGHLFTSAVLSFSDRSAVQRTLMPCSPRVDQLSPPATYVEHQTYQYLQQVGDNYTLPLVYKCQTVTISDLAVLITVWHAIYKFKFKSFIDTRYSYRPMSHFYVARKHRIHV